MSSSALSRFPAEIVQQIVADVPNADLPAARLLGKNFSNIAAPRLFSAIPLWISLKSLNNLTNLASQPQLRGYVKEVVFSPLRIIEHENEKNYISAIEDAFEYELDSSNARTLQIAEHMASYRGYLGAQQYLAKGSRDVKIMCRAFRQFPALNTATICYSHQVSGWPCSNTGAYTLSAFTRGLDAAGVKIANLNFGLPLNVTDSKQKCLSSSTNVAPFRSLWASNPTDITDKALEAAFTVIDNIDDSSIRLISELRVLKIHKKDEESTITLNIISNAITKIISKAPQLETVSIERLSPQVFPEYINPCYLFDLPRSQLHPLRNLALQNMVAGPDELVDFLQRYVGSLVTVIFVDMVCRDEYWYKVLDRLRAFTFPNLRQFRLDHCFNYSVDFGFAEDLDATDYLLHKTDENPHSGF